MHLFRFQYREILEMGFLVGYKLHNYPQNSHTTFGRPQVNQALRFASGLCRRYGVLSCRRTPWRPLALRPRSGEALRVPRASVQESLIFVQIVIHTVSVGSTNCPTNTWGQAPTLQKADLRPFAAPKKRNGFCGLCCLGFSLLLHPFPLHLRPRLILKGKHTSL